MMQCFSLGFPPCACSELAHFRSFRSSVVCPYCRRLLDTQLSPLQPEPLLPHCLPPAHPDSNRFSCCTPDAPFPTGFPGWLLNVIRHHSCGLLKTENDNVLLFLILTPVWPSCPCSERSGPLRVVLAKSL